MRHLERRSREGFLGTHCGGWPPTQAATATGTRAYLAALAGLFSDNQDGCRIASSRNAPERVEHCLTRMLPAQHQFVNRTLGFRTARRSTLQPYLSSIDRAKLKELLTQTGPAAVAKAMGICVINRLQSWALMEDKPYAPHARPSV
jgi:hypothetical protein